MNINEEPQQKCKQIFKLHTFNKIFSSKISNNLLAKNISFAHDLFEGINSTHIVHITSGQMGKFFTMGNF